MGNVQLQQQVYQSRVHGVDELKQRLLHVWHSIDQTITDNALLTSGVGGVFGYVSGQKADFEQLLWQYSVI